MASGQGLSHQTDEFDWGAAPPVSSTAATVAAPAVDSAWVAQGSVPSTDAVTASSTAPAAQGSVKKPKGDPNAGKVGIAMASFNLSNAVRARGREVGVLQRGVAAGARCGRRPVCAVLWAPYMTHQR